MSKHTRFISAALIVTGALMIAACAGLIWWNAHQSSEAQKSSEELASQAQSVISQRRQEASSYSADNSSGSAIEEMKKRMPVVDVDGNDCIGYLTIASVDLKLPVLNSYSEYKLNIAPCRYYGSLETDDLVIAGHNFNSSFEKLKSLKDNDTVLFTNMDGETFKYRVEETEMLKPAQVTDMVKSSYELSLYTCNYSGSERFTVRCRSTD